MSNTAANITKILGVSWENQANGYFDRSSFDTGRPFGSGGSGGRGGVGNSASVDIVIRTGESSAGFKLDIVMRVK